MGIVTSLLMMAFSGLVAAICLWQVLPKVPYAIGLAISVVFFTIAAAGSRAEMVQIKKQRGTAQ